ncbi:hypothetical protein [Mesorhizobium sp.]|uniref:hypothetical protein n=1 Tax=Mesorhizobium sp. TaxID=1871066 RepID=UPI001223AAC5|nr:hypothetical protein [Mesorhizobium sp.]TJV14893.1 MAG: hypothetical protein E5Y07_24525 [Mesorhizobium sp.]
MTDSGLGGLALDPATRALFEFVNSPGMKQAQLAFRGLPESPAFKEAQKLAAAFRGLPESPAFKEAQKLAAAFRAVPENPAFKEAQKLVAAIRDLQNSPALTEAQKLVAAIRDLQKSPALTEAQKLVAAIRDFPKSPALTEAQKLVAAIRDLAKSSALTEAQKQVSAFSAFAASTPHDSPTVNAIKGLAIAINTDPTEYASTLEHFSNSSAGRIIQEIAYSRITEAEDEAEAPVHSIGSIRSDRNPISIAHSDIHNEILKSLSAIRDTLDKNSTSRSEKLLSLFIFPAVLSLFCVILSAYLSSYDLSKLSSSMRDDLQSGDERVIQKITEKLYEIEVSIDRLAQRKESNLSFYLVVRAAPLNWEKKYSGGHYILLQPGQRVEVLRRSGKWLEVRTILADHTEIAGWVLKKYLRSAR